MNRTPDDTALALAAAAIDYHRREQKTFWWDHFRRLTAPVWEWADQRDVLIITEAQVLVPWHRDGRQKLLRRVLQVSGMLGPGSSIGVGAAPFLLYDVPYPPIARSTEPGARTAHNKVTVLEVIDENVFVLEERLEADAPEHDELPMAFTPATPPPPGNAGRRDFAVGRATFWTPTRGCCRTRHSTSCADSRRTGRWPRGESAIDSIRDSLLSLGPQLPGGAGPARHGQDLHRLQGHRRTGGRARLEDRGGRPVARGRGEHADRGAGCGTGRLPRRQEAEAGRRRPRGALDVAARLRRFPPSLGRTASCWAAPRGTSATRSGCRAAASTCSSSTRPASSRSASTIASAVAARRLLLLGDPQQLPQVSQGTHPEPVDDVGPRLAQRRAQRAAQSSWASSWRAAGGCIRGSARPCRSWPTKADSLPRRRAAARWSRSRRGCIRSRCAHVVQLHLVRRGSRPGRRDRPIAARPRAGSLRRRDASAAAGRPDRGGAVQRAGRVDQAADARGRDAAGACWHGGQVPGAGGGGVDRVAGRVLGCRGAARPGVPAAAEPAQCCDLAGAVGGVPALLARSSPNTCRRTSRRSRT